MKKGPFDVLFLWLSIFFFLPFVSQAQSSNSLSKDLNKQLAELDRQISIYREEIYHLKQKNLTLKEEIDLVEKNIEKNELQIKASEVTLRGLKAQSDRSEREIGVLDADIFRKKILLAKSLQGMYQVEGRSTVEAFLSQYGFSQFFDHIQYLGGLHKGLQSVLADILDQKSILDNKKEDLDSQLSAQSRLITLRALQQEELTGEQNTKERLIKENTVHASAFTQKSQALESVREEVRRRLYVLQGLTKSVNLDEAFKKANLVSERVGINPILLMAVLKVESDLGTNIGGGNWKTDMHPKERDAFLAITQTLGLDADKTPVSAAPRYGWGGAMGPAQFLPTTWLAYQQRITKITGHHPPSPWDLEDAFAAAGVKLSANGATDKTYESEWQAAMRYFAGGNWKNPAYAFYGDRVMDVKAIIAASYQGQ